MNTWQEWVTVLVGAVVTFLIGSNQLEKARKQKELDELKFQLTKANDKIAMQSERITKLESEVVSDKDVREILKEFFFPFMTTLSTIQEDIQKIKVDMAEVRGRAQRTEKEL